MEALGDPIRYFLPSIRNHERTAGVGAVPARYQVDGGVSALRLDARVYPDRALTGPGRRPSEDGGPGSGRDLAREFVCGLMVGYARDVDGGDPMFRAEVRLDPIILYAEFQRGSRRNEYFYIQYVQRAWS
jgi:hypothetical protein